MGEAIKRLVDHAVQQSSRELMAQSATQTKRAARETLLNDHMRPIAAVSWTVTLEKPEVVPLKMPRAYLAPGLLIARAEGFASEAKRYEADYIHAGLPTDFLASMKEAIQQLREVGRGGHGHRAARAGATAGVHAELSQARKLLKVMDSFVTRAVHDKPALLAEWKHVKRLPRPKKARAAISSGSSPRLLTTGPATATARIAVEEPQPAGMVGAIRRLLRRGAGE